MLANPKNTAQIQHTASAISKPSSNKLEGVVVEGELNGRRASCSGFTFAGGRYVLTQGVLISALQDKVTPIKKGILLSVLSSPNLRFNIVREKSSSNNNVARIAAWWSCPLIGKSARDFRAQGWQIVPDGEADVLGLMLVLTVGDHNASSNNIQEALFSLLKDHVIPAGLPSFGSPVLLESTPFAASSLFLNSWTRGVVSAVTGENNSLFLCDVHAAPGCEGGAMYTPQRDLLLGMVVLPFCLVRGEAVSLCLCAAFGPVLSNLFKISTINMNPAVKDEQSNNGVALLRHGHSWASAVGIQREPAIFLTCSHVLQQETSTTTLQWPNGGNPRPAKVLFRTSPKAAFDLAVLQVQGPGPQFPPPPHSPPVKGEEVIVCGYSVLTPSRDTLGPPLVSRGCVSQVCPAMLQTTCAVQSGASGGAVLRAGTNQLLGIVVGHMRTLNAEPLPTDWPRINFAVPVTAIAPAIRAFLATGDAKELQALENQDSTVQRLWNLDLQSKL